MFWLECISIWIGELEMIVVMVFLFSVFIGMVLYLIVLWVVKLVLCRFVDRLFVV